MSLCIAVNNPGQCVIICGDGRVMKGNEIVSDSHKKLTTLTSQVSMFCSGVQNYCEQLREVVSSIVNQRTPIHEIATIVKEESIKVHQQFMMDCPTYYDVFPEGACLATVLAFYDIDKKECGMMEYCHRNGFDPRTTIGCEMSARGIGQEMAINYLPQHFDSNYPIESVLNTYKVISKEEDHVGGNIIVHVITQAGTDQYLMESGQ